MRKFCDQDEAFIQEMITTLLEKIPEELEALNNGLSQKDSDATYRAVHGLKSSLHLAGLPYIQADMEQLEEQIKSGKFKSGSTQKKLKELLSLGQYAIGELQKLKK